MPADNKLELVGEVDVNKANASIKSINTGLSSMEQAAAKAARAASAAIEGLTVSMVKGPTLGNLLLGGLAVAGMAGGVPIFCSDQWRWAGAAGGGAGIGAIRQA